jgi:hypothetical protein
LRQDVYSVLDLGMLGAILVIEFLSYKVDLRNHDLYSGFFSKRSAWYAARTPRSKTRPQSTEEGPDPASDSGGSLESIPTPLAVIEASGELVSDGGESSNGVRSSI